MAASDVAFEPFASIAWWPAANSLCLSISRFACVQCSTLGVRTFTSPRLGSEEKDDGIRSWAEIEGTKLKLSRIDLNHSASLTIFGRGRLLRNQTLLLGCEVN